MIPIARIISREELNYVHENILFFSLEHLDEYVYFYRDGTNSITTQSNKLLTDLHNQFKHDEFGKAFYGLKDRVQKLKVIFNDLDFNYDVILFNEEENG